MDVEPVLGVNPDDAAIFAHVGWIHADSGTVVPLGGSAEQEGWFPIYLPLGVKITSHDADEPAMCGGGCSA